MIGKALLTHLLCFGELSDDDKCAVEALQGEVRTFGRYRDILRAGDRPPCSIVVLRGFLQRYIDHPGGNRQIVSFYMPTDAPSLETLHIDVLDDNLATVVESRIGIIPHDALNSLMAEHPDVLGLIWRQTLVQASIAREWMMRNSRLSAPVAMAHLFCEIYLRSRSVGQVDNGSCAFPVTQDLLAQALGLTAVHVNRTLQQLRDTGIIEHRAGRLQVHDFTRLAAIAEFNPNYLHLHC